jgi:TPP-dependent pyruvate/acetoin dehydrogenase alpha subunit
LVHSIEVKNIVSNLQQSDPKLLLDIFKKLFKIRTVEETIAKKYTEWEMRCPTHLSTGQEGIAAGVCQALQITDYVLSTHRSHAHYLAKGGDLKKMMAEIYGKESGCSKGRGGSMHLIDKNVGFMCSTSIVGGTIPLAAGLALSSQLKGESKIACVFFGDAATEEGVFFETINFAAVRKLPILFICENNLYSVYSPLECRQPVNRKIFEMVNGIGIPSVAGNGNDALETYYKSLKFVNEIRNGAGPRFIELSTYRWREHCGPFFDNDIGYRSEAEYESWKLRDPLLNFENQLINNKKIPQERIDAIKTEIKSDVIDAFQFADESPFPDISELYSNLYYGDTN